MTEKDEKLIYTELCARLPYGVKTDFYLWDEEKCEEVLIPATIYQVNTDGYVKVSEDDEGEDIEIERIKMWLRPIASMTDEEMDRLFDILRIDKDGRDEDWIKINDELGIKFFFPTGKWVEWVAEAYDYLNSIHIDYRGLIRNGLALEVTEENNPYNAKV